jgi:hypothetical protein
MKVLRHLAAFLLDAALMLAFLACFALVLRGGAAGALIAASLVVSCALAGCIVEQLQVRQVEEPGLVDRQGRAIYDGAPRRANR